MKRTPLVTPEAIQARKEERGRVLSLIDARIRRMRSAKLFNGAEDEIRWELEALREKVKEGHVR